MSETQVFSEKSCILFRSGSIRSIQLVKRNFRKKARKSFVINNSTCFLPEMC